jgi:hypothetical protein
MRGVDHEAHAPASQLLADVFPVDRKRLRHVAQMIS